MKKKITVVFLTILMGVLCAFGLVACKNSGGNSDTGDNTGGDIGNNGEQTHVHSGEWIVTKEATCTENGSRYRVCSECGETETQVIPKKDHSFNSENICTVCGYELQITVGLEYVEYDYKQSSYPYNTEKSYAVTGMGIATDRDIVIPAYYMGKKVRKIADSAFSGKDVIKSVYIASGVTEIENKAFYYCSSMEKATLPTSVETIGSEAFAYCSKLGGCTFYDKLKEIAANAFNGCTRLSEIGLPDQGIKIGAKAFYNTAYYNQKQNWEDGVLYVGNHVLATNELFKSESYTIPATVKSVASSTFENQIALKEIIIKANFLTFGENIFSNTGLIKATVPYGCLSLLSANNITELTVTTGSITKELRDFTNLKNLSVNYFYNASSNSPLQGLGKLESLTVTKLDGYRLGAMFGKEYFNGAVSVAQKSATYDSKTDTYKLSNTADTFYIPSSLHSVTVLSGSITRCAFYGCTMLTEVTYGKDVSMNYYALFGCNNVEYLNYMGDLEEYCTASKEKLFNCINNSYNQLQHATIKLNGNVLQGEITVPSSVTNLVTATFEGQTKITKVNLPDGLKSIGKFAFGCSGITSIEIPESVISIENDAFNWCKSLTSVRIGNGVTSIGSDAFRDCSGLTSITIPNSVTSIAYEAFRGCEKLIQIENGVRYVDKWVVGCDRSATSIAVRTNTIGIGDEAFRSYSGLTSITIPNSLMSIGNYAFRDCKELTTVNWNAENCTKAGNNSFPIFNGCTKLNEVHFGENVQTIPSYAFYGCSGITSVVIPNSVTSIGERAFSGCSGITSVVIPDNVTSIGNYAFYECSGLTSVAIPNSVTSIGNGAFYNCSGLTSVAIPNSVTSIGNSAFYNCSGLTSVAIPNSVTSIGNGAFYNCGGLTSVTIPDSVTNIDNYAFSGCSGLTSVTIGNSVTSIGERAFSGCSGITSVVIPDNVTSIGNYAFYECSGLTSVTIGNGVTSIGERTFSNCSGLADILIPNSVTSIGNSAFRGCTELRKITIPDSVTHIERYAFYETAYYRDENNWQNNILYIGNHLIIARSVTSGEYQIREGTKTIADNAFNCSPKRITMPISISYIGNFIFNNWNVTIIFQGTKEQWMKIGRYALWNWNSSGSSAIGVGTGIILQFLDDES